MLKNRVFSFLFLFVFMGLLLASLQIRTVQATAITITRTFSSQTYDGYIQGSYVDNYTKAWLGEGGVTVFDSKYYICIGQDLWITYFVFRGFLMFDTELIPEDVNLTDAILSIYVMGNHSTTDFNVTIQNGQPTYPHIPIISGDYSDDYYSENGGSRNTSTISALGYWNISLTSDGKSWINTEGTTKLCLRSDRDINMTEPSGNEFIKIYGAEQGESYASKLYITYETEGYHYIVHGPYYENGNVANANVSLTLQIENMASQTNYLNGTDGVADDLDIQIEQRGVAFTWNITEQGLNQTRTYYLTAASFEELWIFIPNPDTPCNLYTFTITDFAGVTNAYIETIINVAGNNRIVERQKLDVLNSLPFWMQWASRYDIRLICDEGTYTWGGFIALTEQSQTLIITQDIFPTIYPGLNVTVNALRFNATWIQANYSDGQSLTSWVKMDFKYKQGYSWITAYSTNNTGNSQQINWYGADATKDYRVTVTALRNGETKTWSFSCPKLGETANPWEGLFDILGTFPFPAANFFGLCIVLMVLGLFSYKFLAIGCALTWLMTAFLTYIGWLSVPWSLLSLSAFIVVLIALKEGKKTEREI